MPKIVYNARYGGFSISEAAVRRGREISGDPKWGGVLKGEQYSDGQLCTSHFNMFGREIPRTDLVLVQVVKELGAAANGACAELRITDLPSGTLYRIDDYDGNESIETKDTYDWNVA